MTAKNLPPDTRLIVDQIHRRLNRLERSTPSLPGIKFAGDGTPYFPGGFYGGGGSMQRFIEPPEIPAPSSLIVDPGSSFDTIFFDISWTVATGYGADQIERYEVQLFKPGETIAMEFATANAVNPQVRAQPLEPATTYEVRVMSVTRTGRRSPPLVGTAVTGTDSSVPASPTFPASPVSVGIQSLAVQWIANTERDVANGAGLYRVIVSKNSNLSSPVKSITVSGTSAYISGLDAEIDHYVGVSAIDSSGNESPIATVPGGPWKPLTAISAEVAYGIGGGNLVKNSRFDATLTHWTQGGGTWIGDASVYRYGVRSIKTSSVNTDAWLYQDVVLPKGFWMVSAWTKAMAVTSASGSPKGVVLHLAVQSGTLGTSGGHFGGTATAGPHDVVVGLGTWDWKRSGLRIEVTSSQATIRLVLQRGLGGGCSGEAWFDGIQAEQGQIPTAYAPRPDEILPGTIGPTEIADDSITTPKLVANAIVSSKIAADQIGTRELAAASVTTTELAALAVTTAKLAAGAVTANELAANSVTTAKLAANSVDATKIVANTITATQLAVTLSMTVGKNIQSSNYVAGSTGWRIAGDGSAEFSNMTVRGSSWVGGSINIANRLIASAGSGEVRLAANVEIGSDYSGTLYSGSGSEFGLQVGNSGLPAPPGTVWTHLQANLSSANFFLAMYDTSKLKRVWYANSASDMWAPGPEGRIIAEKKDQNGDFASKGLLVQNGPTASSGNPDHAGIALHTPNHGVAAIIQLVGTQGESIEFRNSTNAAYIPIKASAFQVNSHPESKEDIRDLDLESANRLLKLKTVRFRRPSPQSCTQCAGTGKLLEDFDWKSIFPESRRKNLSRGDDCPVCDGKPNSIKRNAGTKVTEDSDNYGFLSTDVGEVLPDTVVWTGTSQRKLKPEAIDVMAILALAVRKIQDLEERLVLAETRIND